VTAFSNSAWANRVWKPSQHEEANWLREMEPAKRVEIQEIVADRLSELRSWPLPPEVGAENVRYIHKSLFYKLHWAAGDYRGTPIGEIGTAVSHVSGSTTTEEVAKRMNEVFHRLQEQKYLRGLPKEEFVLQEANLVNGIINYARPFYYGNSLVTKFIAEHVAKNAGFRLDLMVVPESRFNMAISEAGRADFLPLRKIVRDQSRPEAAIVFEAAMKSGNWSAIYTHPRFQHANDIVIEAIGGFNARVRIAEGDLSSREKAIIRRVQAELNAGRLKEAPTGRDRDWYFGKTRGRDR
jgi:fido (protein-threonine AMPylation protein)